MNNGESAFVVEEIPCCRCGAVTQVHALGWEAMPVLDTFVGACCRRYIGDLDWDEQ